MAKLDRLVAKLSNSPNNFTWGDLVSLLTKLGFEQKEGNGSRVRFYHKEQDCLITCDKPHPRKVLGLSFSKRIEKQLQEHSFIE